MTVSTASNPDKFINFEYNKGLWIDNLSIEGKAFGNPLALLDTLKKKYKKVYVFRLNILKSFSQNYVKPIDLYKEDMENKNFIPNCIMVATDDRIMLVTAKAKRAKEFVAFGGSAKNIYVPVLISKNTQGIPEFINLY